MLQNRRKRSITSVISNRYKAHAFYHYQDESKYTIHSEPVLNTCAKFGCKRSLSLAESLAGKYCTGHNLEKQVDVMRVLKFK